MSLIQQKQKRTRAIYNLPCTVAGITFGLLMAATTAHAAGTPAGLSIARMNACMSCHIVDRKLVGPSFQQIAARYKGKPGAQAYLEQKVRTGGAGTWGVIPMPSHPGMKAADIKTVVAWVLAGAPSK